MKNINGRLLFRIAVSIVAIAYLYQKIDWHEITKFDSTIVLYLLTSLSINSICLFIMSIRWKLIIDNFSTAHANIFTLYKFYFIGMFFNIFLPGAIGGDFMRIYMSNAEYKLNLKTATSFVFTERILGLIGVCLIFLIGHVFTNTLFKFLDVSDKSMTFLATISISLLIYVTLYIKVKSIITYELVLVLLVLSILGQFGDIMIVKLFSIYFNLDISITQLMVIMPLVYIATIMPISFGGLGIREGVIATLFLLLGISPSISVVISILLYFTKVIMAFVGWIIYIKMPNNNWDDLQMTNKK